MRSGVTLSVAVATLVMGCSSTKSDATPTADAGVDAAPASTVPPLAGDYSCVGKITVRAPTSATANVPFMNIDSFSNVPLTQATVKACAITDTACASPLLTTTTSGTGIASLDTLPLGATGFDGYFEVSVENEPHNLNFVSPPIIGDRPYQRIYWSLAALTRLAQIANVTYDPTRGHVFIEAHDCVQYPGGVSCEGQDTCKLHSPGGVAFELDVQDPAIVLAYIAPPAISRTAGGTTDTYGQGGFINVPPGPVTLTGKIASTGKIVSRQKLFVRAGAFSMVVLQPSPTPL